MVRGRRPPKARDELTGKFASSSLAISREGFEEITKMKMQGESQHESLIKNVELANISCVTCGNAEVRTPDPCRTQTIVNTTTPFLTGTIALTT